MPRSSLRLFLPSLMALYCFFVAATNTLAQKKTLSGYYITNSGDSVRGAFPDYADWDGKSTSVKFIPQQATKPIDLYPTSVKQFSVDGYDTYISYSGKRLINPIEASVTYNKSGYSSPKDLLEDVTTFLRFVTKSGECSLYVLSDKIRNNFFYQLDSMPLVELRYKMYYAESRVVEVADFRQQCYILFKDQAGNRNLNADLARLNYSEDDLVKLFDRMKPAALRLKRQKNPASGFVIGAGAFAGNVSVTSDSDYVEKNRLYKTVITPLVTIGYMGSLSRHSSRYFIYPHIIFSTYKSTTEVIINPDVVDKIKYSAPLTITPVVDFGYNIINTRLIKWFVSAGGSASLLAKNKEHIQAVRISDGYVLESGSKSVSSITYNANVTTGLTFLGKIAVRATYNTNMPFGDADLHVSLKSSYVTVSYKFN